MKRVTAALSLAILIAALAAPLTARLRATTLTSGQSISTGGSISEGSCTLSLVYSSLYFGGSYVLSFYSCGDGWGSWLDGTFWPGHVNQSGAVGAGGYLIMQSDGNLVLYTSGGTPRWNTQTNGNSGAYFNVQGDANLVVYSSTNAPLWTIL